MEIQLLKPSSLKNYEKNPRINKNAVAKIKQSLREYGFRQPIVVDEDMVILAGHTRLAASLELQLKKVPVHIAKGLSEAQKKSYRIMDNKSAEIADWNTGLLKDELIAIGDLDFDMTLTGFDLGEINKITADQLLSFASEVDDEEDNDIDDITDYAPSNVKLVQLFYNTETEERFRNMAKELQSFYKLDNLSDVVYKVIEDASKTIKSKS